MVTNHIICLCQGYLTLLNTPQATAQSIHSYPGILFSFEIRDKELFYRVHTGTSLRQVLSISCTEAVAGESGGRLAGV